MAAYSGRSIESQPAVTVKPVALDGGESPELGPAAMCLRMTREIDRSRLDTDDIVRNARMISPAGRGEPFPDERRLDQVGIQLKKVGPSSFRQNRKSFEIQYRLH